MDLSSLASIFESQYLDISDDDIDLSLSEKAWNLQ